MLFGFKPAKIWYIRCRVKRQRDTGAKKKQCTESKLSERRKIERQRERKSCLVPRGAEELDTSKGFTCTACFIYALLGCSLPGWLAGWIVNLLAARMKHWLTGWMTWWLADWLTDWCVMHDSKSVWEHLSASHWLTLKEKVSVCFWGSLSII